MPNKFKLKIGITTRDSAIGEESARLIYYLFEAKFNNSLSYNDCYAVQLMPIRVCNTGWTVCDRSNQEDTRKGRGKTFGNYFLIKENN